MEVDPERLRNLIESAGHRPRRYSGRAMYGRECLGVDCPDVLPMFSDLLQAVLDLGEEPGQLEELVVLLRDARTDQMGRGMIVYWPEVPYVDTEEGEDEG